MMVASPASLCKPHTGHLSLSFDILSTAPFAHVCRMSPNHAAPPSPKFHGQDKVSYDRRNFAYAHLCLHRHTLFLRQHRLESLHLSYSVQAANYGSFSLSTSLSVWNMPRRPSPTGVLSLYLCCSCELPHLFLCLSLQLSDLSRCTLSLSLDAQPQQYLPLSLSSLVPLLSPTYSFSAVISLTSSQKSLSANRARGSLHSASTVKVSLSSSTAIISPPLMSAGPRCPCASS
ncbi:hypothetical protein KP509_10G089600 [Ceratopteris richardii]|uniref:Uncharacterized protein n=1 Tax=Ceratopteris richardii TaxID=49495 RepID=A0A8T2U164_CERRI|nr:hypothetical protein KP509_10G089600 [Ceratopteris richardii]